MLIPTRLLSLPNAAYSFPGGKRDPEDTSLYHTALRETSEELGISPDRVEFVGKLGEPEVSLGGLLVHVFVVSLL